jgi:hypothetical protein
MKRYLIALAASVCFTVNSAGAVTVVNGSLTDQGGNYNTFNGMVPSGWQQVPFGTTDIFDANTNFNGFTWNSSADGGTFIHSLYTMFYRKLTSDSYRPVRRAGLGF